MIDTASIRAALPLLFYAYGLGEIDEDLVAGQPDENQNAQLQETATYPRGGPMALYDDESLGWVAEREQMIVSRYGARPDQAELARKVFTFPRLMNR
jgi:hypothetical protein